MNPFLSIHSFLHGQVELVHSIIEKTEWWHANVGLGKFPETYKLLWLEPLSTTINRPPYRRWQYQTTLAAYKSLKYS